MFETTRLNARTVPIARASSPETSGGAQPAAPTISAPARTAADSFSWRVCAEIGADPGTHVVLIHGQVDEHGRDPVAELAVLGRSRTLTGTSATGARPSVANRSGPAAAR